MEQTLLVAFAGSRCCRRDRALLAQAAEEGCRYTRCGCVDDADENEKNRLKLGLSNHFCCLLVLGRCRRLVCFCCCIACVIVNCVCNRCAFCGRRAFGSFENRRLCFARLRARAVALSSSLSSSSCACVFVRVFGRAHVVCDELTLCANSETCRSAKRTSRRQRSRRRSKRRTNDKTRASSRAHRTPQRSEQVRARRRAMLSLVRARCLSRADRRFFFSRSVVVFGTTTSRARVFCLPHCTCAMSGVVARVSCICHRVDNWCAARAGVDR